MTKTLLKSLTVVLALAFAMPAVAQERLVPENRAQVALSFAPLVKRTAPAVVNIYTRKVVSSRPMSPLFDDPLFRQFFGGGNPFGAPQQRVENSLGSGVIVQADGLIVTNHHVITGADQIMVVLSDRREFEASVVADDQHADLAALRIHLAGGERLPFLELHETDDLEVGDLVLAIGNPFGVGQTVTNGIISALARTAIGASDYNYFIQTDAAINPGNSGGALIGMDGRLVGINSAIYSRSGGSQGIGFAIPASLVRSIVDAAGRGGRLVRPWLGVSGQPVTPDIASSIGLATPSGVLVKRVDPDSPVGRGDVHVGDVITAVNGRVVEDPDALRFRIATLPIGSPATLTVVHGGQAREVSFAVMAPPETPPRQQTRIRGNSPFTGATVVNLSPAVIEETGLEAAPKGVLITAVDDNSVAQQVGLAVGDIVVSVNGRGIGSVDELVAELGARPRQWHFSIRRGDRVLEGTG
ncbi:MAG: Do family serine endopeptidase [Azospirillaceae bacterium]|nr:Do family serine endopeptidase [Azospirillaceae bacterium]